MTLEEAIAYLRDAPTRVGPFDTPIAVGLLERACWYDWFSSLTYGDNEWGQTPWRCLWINEKQGPSVITLVQFTFYWESVRVFVAQNNSLLLKSADQFPTVEQMLQRVPR